jgi:hypothetical protein
MKYFQLFKLAQIENFLRQKGYSENLVSLVLSQPKDIQKSIGKLINENSNLSEDQLIQKINSLQIGSIQPQARKQTTQEKLLKIFLDDDSSKLQMREFFNSIPNGYHSFVTKILLNKEIYPHDLATLLENIENYENLKKRNVAIEKNINSFDSYATWINEMSRFSSFDSDAVKLKVDPRNLEGVTLDDSMNGYQIWKITDVESLEEIGLGTKWCTRGDYNPCQAKNYLERFGSLYVITKSGNLIAQFTADLSEIQDTKNVNVEVLPKGLNLDKYIIRTKRRINLASEELRNDKQFMLQAVKRNCMALEFASAALKNNKEVVMEAVKKEGGCLRHASDDMKKNEEVVLQAVIQTTAAIMHASSELRKDKKFILRVIINKPMAFTYCYEDFRNDKEVVMTAVEKKGTLLSDASYKLKKDEEVVLAAIKQDPAAMIYASESLKSQKEFLLKAIQVNDYVLLYISKEISTNKDFLLDAIKINGKALRFLSSELPSNKQFMLQAIKFSADAMYYVNDDLKLDKKFVLEAVKQNGLALEFISWKFKGDKDVVLQALLQNPEAIQYAHRDFQNDPDILASVNQQKTVASGWYHRIKLSFARK